LNDKKKLIEKQIYYKIKNEVVLIELINMKINLIFGLDYKEKEKIYNSIEEPYKIELKIEKEQDEIERYYFQNYVKKFNSNT
jgi:hypothetical protein